MKRRRESRAARRKRIIRNRLIAAGVLVVLILVLIILLASCNSGKRNRKEAESIPVQTSQTEMEETTPEPAAPEIRNDKPVNLYTMNYGDMTCYKVTSISRTWSAYEDLESFGAFLSSADSFEFTSETQAHYDTWNSVETSVSYKIGYELSFDVAGEHKVVTILKPEDIESSADLYSGNYPEDEDYSGITGYMGVWVYDDLHQEEGAFYAHITQSEVTDETLLTSIKLRPTPQSDQISNLVLKAFSYSSPEEFDSNGHYAGNYAAQVAISRE